MADLNFLAKTEDTSSATSAATYRGRDVFAVLFSFLSVILFVVAILGMGGLFLYYQYQVKNINDLATEKRAIQDDIRPELIQRLVFVNNALIAANQLLQSHVFASQLFPQFLEKNIHQSVLVNDFKLSVDTRKLELSIVAPNYTVLADQIRLFENDPAVEKVSFQNPTLGDQNLSALVAVTFKQIIFQKSQ